MRIGSRTRPRQRISPQADVLPPPGTYREFDVKDSNGNNPSLADSTDSFIRTRRDDLSAPQSFYRCTAIAVRNLSAQTITVALPGRPATIVPPNTTDIINSGNTFIDTYTVTADGTVAQDELLLVERCRAWNGWNRAAQDLG